MSNAEMFTEAELSVLGNLTVALAEARRGIAALQALEANIMNAALALALEHTDPVRPGADLPVRAVAAELGAAVRVSDRTIQRQLSQAAELTGRFPATLAALAAGQISRAHVTVIVDAGHRIVDDEARARFEEQVLPVAERESATRVRGFAQRIAEQLMAEPLEERHARAAADRRVAVTDVEDGMSELFLYGPSGHVHAVFDRMTQMGRAVLDVPAGADSAADADERTLDQLRADLLIDLALSGAPTAHGPVEALGRIRGEVCVTVPVLTLAGEPGDPAMLDGVQPIDTATALQLVGASPGWDRVLTHPIAGAVLAVDRYRSSAGLKRYLRAIDGRCRFPCCMMPVRRCDLDHEREHALGGETSADNLTDKCRRHHVLRHHSPWRSRREPDGAVVWTSPAGVEYIDRPPPPVTFFPDPPF
ncbi:MAG: DUF222 domain-containing protein [Microbacterium sp.]|uniref:HNH endonuclease signature motif containing protein n=1 Tax=Microbacterium sp. TaxID=51671 RepID=UPI0039E64673